MTNETKIEHEADAGSLAKRADEMEDRWRKLRGLTKQVNHKSNAKPMKRRRRKSNPKEPKGAAKFRQYRDKKLGKLGAASRVRRIDPTTGTERT